MAKLLIVEDDVLLDEAYRRKCETDYETRIVTDGVSGIKETRKWKPDIILLDIYLPGKSDGLDVLREIKKDPELAKIPVLVITNLPDAAEKVIALGADKCFMKTDVDLDLIKENLDSLLVKREI